MPKSQDVWVKVYRKDRMMVKHDTCKRTYISLFMLELWTFALTSTRLMYTNHFQRRFSMQDVIRDCCCSQCPEKKLGWISKNIKINVLGTCITLPLTVTWRWGEISWRKLFVAHTREETCQGKPARLYILTKFYDLLFAVVFFVAIRVISKPISFFSACPQPWSVATGNSYSIKYVLYLLWENMIWNISLCVCTHSID